MIYLLIAIIALTWFSYWTYKHIGIPTSHSSTYYHDKTSYTYLLVIGGIGVLMSFVEPHSLLHYAGASLCLGTLAPAFRSETSVSKLIHFGLTALTAILGFAYIGGWWMGLAGGILIGASKLIESKKPQWKPVWVAEQILFYTTLIGALIMKL